MSKPEFIQGKWVVRRDRRDVFFIKLEETGDEQSNN